MTETEPAAIAQFRKEFEHHTSSGNVSPFYASNAVSESFGKFSRDLEAKRQLHTLTASEKKWLAAIDDLVGKSAQFNRAMAGGEGAVIPESAVERVYNLKEGRLTAPEESADPVFAPKISGDEADRIIQAINRQFREKVLSKIDRRQKFRFPPRLERQSPQEHSTNMTGAPDGRNLEDYISSIRGNLPNLPFADEDSHFDLSRMVSRNK